MDSFSQSRERCMSSDVSSSEQDHYLQDSIRSHSRRVLIALFKDPLYPAELPSEAARLGADISHDVTLVHESLSDDQHRILHAIWRNFTPSVPPAQRPGMRLRSEDLEDESMDRNSKGFELRRAKPKFGLDESEQKLGSDSQEGYDRRGSQIQDFVYGDCSEQESLEMDSILSDLPGSLQTLLSNATKRILGRTLSRTCRGNDAGRAPGFDFCYMVLHNPLIKENMEEVCDDLLVPWWKAQGWLDLMSHTRALAGLLEEIRELEHILEKLPEGGSEYKTTRDEMQTRFSRAHRLATVASAAFEANNYTLSADEEADEPDSLASIDGEPVQLDQDMIGLSRREYEECLDVILDIMSKQNGAISIREDLEVYLQNAREF